MEIDYIRALGGAMIFVSGVLLLPVHPGGTQDLTFVVTSSGDTAHGFCGTDCHFLFWRAVQVWIQRVPCRPQKSWRVLSQTSFRGLPLSILACSASTIYGNLT